MDRKPELVTQLIADEKTWECISHSAQQTSSVPAVAAVEGTTSLATPVRQEVQRAVAVALTYSLAMAMILVGAAGFADGPLRVLPLVLAFACKCMLCCQSSHIAHSNLSHTKPAPWVPSAVLLQRMALPQQPVVSSRQRSA